MANVRTWGSPRSSRRPAHSAAPVSAIPRTTLATDAPSHGSVASDRQDDDPGGTTHGRWRTTVTGTGERRTTVSATLPRRTRVMPSRPWLPMTTWSTPWSLA